MFKELWLREWIRSKTMLLPLLMLTAHTTELTCARPCGKGLPCMNTFHFHDNPMRRVFLLSSVYTRGTWGRWNASLNSVHPAGFRPFSLADVRHSCLLLRAAGENKQPREKHLFFTCWWIHSGLNGSRGGVAMLILCCQGMNGNVLMECTEQPQLDEALHQVYHFIYVPVVLKSGWWV